MLTIYHLWLSPPCRLVRLVCEEKGLDYQLKAEKTWERREAFLKMNPAGEVPVLVNGKAVIAGHMAILEYLEEMAPEPSLFPNDMVARAGARRLLEWFLFKFQREVTNPLLTERVLKKYLKMGGPDAAKIRAGQTNLGHHLSYLEHLAGKRNYLNGADFSIADLAAAAQISTIDYLGEINWPDYPHVREWYAKVKCRRSFRPLLKDYLAGLKPPGHYTALDF
ncbi:MAG: glutathione S-transferase family protein [Proteobacteria bacterium]|nr:glutathione S-transferase family protein [Pseudomonadota bacterium]